MTPTKEVLIIIPGLGNRAKLYRYVIPIWRLLGYDVYIFSFDWENMNEDFSVALERLTNFIDKLHVKKVAIIGASAGGTAAVNALAQRPQAISRVVTIATPYTHLENLSNAKLRASISFLEHTDIDALKPRILSVYGLHDQVVPVESSESKGIYTKRIYVVRHSFIIAAALTLYSIGINSFVRDI